MNEHLFARYKKSIWGIFDKAFESVAVIGFANRVKKTQLNLLEWKLFWSVFKLLIMLLLSVKQT